LYTAAKPRFFFAEPSVRAAWPLVAEGRSGREDGAKRPDLAFEPTPMTRPDPQGPALSRPSIRAPCVPRPGSQKGRENPRICLAGLGGGPTLETCNSLRGPLPSDAHAA
jgi:hypothetical protein